MQLAFSKVAVESGLMRGLGETQEEKTMDDLRDHNVAVLTLDQYLLPTPRPSGLSSNRCRTIQISMWCQPSSQFCLRKDYMG